MVFTNQLQALATRNLRRPRASCSLPDIGTPTTDTLQIFDTTGITDKVEFRRQPFTSGITGCDVQADALQSVRAREPSTSFSGLGIAPRGP